MPVKKTECSDTMDRVRTIEPFDFRAFSQSELHISPAHLRVLIADPFIHSYAVVVPPLHHEGAWCDKHGHLSVARNVREIPLGHLPLTGKHVIERHLRTYVLTDPLVEVTRADGKAV